MTRLRGLGQRATVLAVALIGVVALGGTALAGHMSSGVKSYTGCLVSGDGVIIKVKEGNSPKSACAGGQVEVHLSGGDITAVSPQTGGGLTGGGADGAVSLSLRRDCSNADVLKWNGSAWACAADSNSTYSAGTGLDLSGGQFSIEPAYRVKNTPDCSSGQFATGFDGDGTIQCSAPPAPSVPSFTAAQANFALGDGVPDDGARHTYVTRSLPAGTYVVLGKGALTRGDDDIGFQSSDGAFGCGVSIGSQTIDQTRFAARDNEEHESYGFSLTGVVATQGGDLILWCDAESDADLVAVRNARVVAVKIG